MNHPPLALPVRKSPLPDVAIGAGAIAVLVFLFLGGRGTLSPWLSGGLAASGGLLMLAGALMWRTRAHAWLAHAREVQASANLAAQENAEQLSLAAEGASRQLGEVWGDLIEVARVETETSINELTNRFAIIVSSLEQSIRVADDSMQGDAVAAVEEHGRAELAGLIAELRESCSRERVMRDRVEALAARIEQLREGADSVQAVAKSATLLSLNAAIEAARAGNSGSGFSVVAAEMQRLSQASGELGVRMAATSAETIASISEAVEAVRDSVRASESAAAAAEQRVASVLDEYSGLTQRIAESGATLAREAHGVNESVSAAIVSLQFQDRTSQILCHVRDSVKRAPATVFAPAAGAAVSTMDPAHELDALSSSYATEQERNVHAGRKTESSSAGEITFF
ncbi:methyl-accepting chemotaxis protein [Pigmentiphaga aceris]|uniref:Methyl-accepting chemotaxis protein n=2 Tax=Pigmentiphaga aceris TaxID=1940612 RepID=A0A5C0B105_9BURK|nr:methyl-accepting chemotaxis protein [Pigmentiphaga aceris]